MLALTIATAVGGFMLGSYATLRYGPTLARAPGSVATALVICALVGAACGLACMNLYLGIYEFIHEPALSRALLPNPGIHAASPDAEIFVSTVYAIATESGVLLAVAAVVFLLAPGHRRQTH